MSLKQKNWEYLPIYRSLFPVFVHFCRLAFKCRNLLFFSNVNPSIEFSGMLGESKIAILNQIPEAFKPQTLFLNASLDTKESLRCFHDSGLSLPLIAKPNIGERGFLVQLIHNEEQLSNYIQQYGIDLILQEYIELPNELAVFYFRLPGETQIHISSVCKKVFLSVKGDGTSTVLDLMEKEARAKRQIERFKIEKPILLDVIIPEGQIKILENIGNHNKGTAFIDASALMNERIESVFQKISTQMKGIHYGRFDLKYNRIEEMEKGENIKIMEFNGVSSEPAHIYDPSIPIAQKYQVYKEHLNTIARIHRIQKERGVACGSTMEFFRFFLHYRKQTDLNHIPRRKVREHEHPAII